MRSVPVLLVVGVLAVGVAACGSDDAGSGSSGGGGTLRVTASTTQLGDFARVVGGDRVRVKQLLQPNSDPHDYEPRPADLTATSDAQVVLESGDGLDRWMADVVDQSGTTGDVVDVGKGRPVVLRRAEDTDEGAKGTADPHWWADPENAEHAVRLMAQRFSSADPAGASTFRTNADRYLARLRDLDGTLHRCIDAVPAGERELVTDHDAFAYFVRHFGITYVGAVIPSTTTQAQPSAGEITALARTVRARGVRAIFPESSLNPKLSEAIARQTAPAWAGRSTPTRSARRARRAPRTSARCAATRPRWCGASRAARAAVEPGPRRAQPAGSMTRARSSATSSSVARPTTVRR